MWIYALNHYQIYLLVLLRMLAFVTTSPIFSLQTWPTTAKLGLGALLALLVAPTIHGDVPSAMSDPGEYVLVALKETAVGILLGLLATTLFSAINMAGQLIDIQIGFSAASLFDPQMGGSTSLTGWFQSMLFTLYFLGMNGLDGLTLMFLHSYQVVPVGHLVWPQHFWMLLTQLLGMALSIAVQMAAPILSALLLTDVTFALLSRAVPQMNVFVVGLPAKLFVGLAMFAVTMPGMVYVFNGLFSSMFNELNVVLGLLGGNG